MKGWHEDDLKFLAGLFDFAAEGGDTWVGFRRAGRLLILARRGHEQDTLRLYEPHRWLSRFAKRLLQWALFFGRSAGGSAMMLTPKEGAALAWLSEVREMEISGMLLGNPSQTQRRLVCLNQDETVLKIGFTDEARAAIEREYQTIKEHAHLPGVPEISDFHRAAGFCFFGIPFYPEALVDQLLELVTAWVLGDQVLVGDYLKECGRSASVPEDLLGIRVSRALEHGDLAPWNIRQDTAGNAVAIDWEFGGEGLAGLDLVHYHFQIATRLKKLGVSKVVTRVCSELSKIPELNDWGWRARDLFQFYVLTTWNLDEGERKAYLTEMK